MKMPQQHSKATKNENYSFEFLHNLSHKTAVSKSGKFFSVKHQIVNMSDLWTTWSLLLLNFAIIAIKKPQVIHKFVGMTLFQ